MQRVSPPAQHGLLHDRAAAGRATDTSPGRRGVALLSAIVCVVIMTAVAASLLRSVLAQVREADRQAFQLQAEALAQSALQRGHQQRTTNPAYLGEVWTPDVLGAPKLKAEIEWTSAATGGTLRVVCLVPADAKLPVRLERTAFLPSPTPVKAE